jgi:hypothetical protein
MAYDFTTASSQYLSTTSAPVTAAPLTMACWFRVASATSQSILLNLGNPAAANGSAGGYRLVVPSSTANLRASQVVTGTASQFADTASNTVVANTWMHGAGVFVTNSSRAVYLSNATAVTNTGTQLTPFTNNFSIGTALNAGTPPYMTGQIAEVGIWNVALTAAEIASLAKGMTCDKVRPQSLVFYAPLIRDLQDTKGGLIITPVNNPTVAPHPRIYK